MIMGGKTFSKIAEAEEGARFRVKNVTNLAFLAPDILDRFSTGKQPVCLTTDTLIKMDLSRIYSAPLRAYSATKEMNHGNRTLGRIQA